MDPKQYLNYCKEIFHKNGNPERAGRQSAYLRNQFEHYGLSAPVWTSLAKSIFKEHGIFENKELAEFVKLAFVDEYREIQYLACEMSQQAQKTAGETFIKLLEFMITHKSWWDTVDWLAKLSGIQFTKYPHQKLIITQHWITSDNMWLNRCAIIFQLLYREKTDEKILYQYILNKSQSREFFIQKASGWALRQYSKTNPTSVEYFIAKHDLPALTVREGLKWLRKNQV